jgi:hypothetical protein
MQLYENEAACGISQVYGNRIACPVSPEGVREWTGTAANNGLLEIRHRARRSLHRGRQREQALGWLVEDSAGAWAGGTGNQTHSFSSLLAESVWRFCGEIRKIAPFCG